eukprot:Opistho-2@94757
MADGAASPKGGKKGKKVKMSLNEFNAAFDSNKKTSWADDSPIELPTGPAAHEPYQPRAADAIGGAFASDSRYGGDRSYGNDRYGDRGNDRGGDRNDRGGDRGYGDRGNRGGYGDRDGGDRPSRPTGPAGEARIPSQPPYTAFVGNLSWEATEDDLARFFDGLKISSIRLVEDRETGKKRGFGYVEFQDANSLKGAVDLTGRPFMNRDIKIDVSESKNTGGGGFGQRSGGFSGGFSGGDAGGDDRTAGSWRTEGAGPLPPRERPSGDRYGGGDRGSSGFGGRGGDRGGDRPSYGDRGDRGDRPSYGDRGGDRYGDREGGRGGYDRPPRDGGYEQRDGPAGARPKLNLQPRTAPVERAAPAAPAAAAAEKTADAPKPSAPKSNPFGSARPVDTSSKERAIEDRLRQERDAAAAEAKKAREAREAREGKPAADGPRERKDSDTSSQGKKDRK